MAGGRNNGGEESPSPDIQDENGDNAPRSGRDHREGERPTATPEGRDDPSTDDPEAEASSAGDPASDAPDGAEVLERVFGPQVTEDDAFRSGFVALVGRPNVGKSTILNRIVGMKLAITSHRPQTTRRRILGIKTTDDAQAIFVDTPGIHRPRNALGRYMVRQARAAIPDADVVAWIVDSSQPPQSMDRSVAGSLRQDDRSVVLVLNKSDKLDPEHIEERVAEYRELAGGVDDWTLTIATKGHNIDRLWTLLRSKLPPGPMLYPADQITDQSERLICAELIREAALRYLRQEIPYGVEVVVDDWEEREDGLAIIGATLYVERDAHKGMVIGKGGRMLKKIGSAARREIERLLERQVFLDIHVSVRPDWRRDEGDLSFLGYR